MEPQRISTECESEAVGVKGGPAKGPIRIGGGNRKPIWHTRLGSFAKMGGKTYRAEASDDGVWFYLSDTDGRSGPYQSSIPIHPTCFHRAMKNFAREIDPPSRGLR